MKIKLNYLLVGMMVLLVACSSETTGGETAVSNNNQSNILTLPSLTAANLSGRPLQVIASTSIIGDVVAQVGGETIELTTLMAAGQDPHSYEPGAQELTAVVQADVIFINGWDLEESLAHDLETIGEDVPIVPISANIKPLTLNEDDHSSADPHVWFNIQNVAQWTENVAQVLTNLDPANAAIYKSNAEAYLVQLAELEIYVEEQLAILPEAKRILITNHDSFGYFAQAYNFEVLGTIAPGSSTLAEPSASDMAALITVMGEHDICTLFSETSANNSLAQTIAAELDGCDTVRVVSLYTGTIGIDGSGAEGYLGMFRTNVDAIVAGLQ
ncbi:MAG: zinc ABC transporter substrate-binding protein [Chloroflexi bacterium]|nr:zinc ABC transporter substrate-binding protein [Chloroflexota bacterium]